MLPGRFIALYGINNIGKSTQARLLTNRFRSAGFKSEHLKYPVYNLDPTGKKLNEIIRGKKDTQSSATRDFFYGTKLRKKANNRLEKILKNQRPKKNQKIVQEITEEELQMWYTLNRYQYQSELEKSIEEGTVLIVEDYTGTGLAWGSAKKANLKWLENINQYLKKPNLEILLDGERFLARKEKNHLHESNDPLMKKCRQVFLNLSKKYGWQVIKADGSILEVSNRIWEVIEKKLM